jgi:hypothetical protein
MTTPIDLLYEEKSSRAGCESKVRPNGLALSRAAPIDREGVRAASSLQKGPISLDAQRRQLVGSGSGAKVYSEEQKR